MSLEFTPKPPRWANRFLEWYCSADLLDEIQGDLLEAFAHRCKEMSLFKAKFWFILDVLRFFRLSSFDRSTSSFNSYVMLKNYFHVSIRNFTKNKAYSIINLFGLVVGIISCLLISLYVIQEFSFDRFHSKKDSIYRVVMDTYGKNGLENSYATAFPAVATSLKDDLPEIKKFVRILDASGVYSTISDNGTELKFNETTAVFSDKSFFEIFDFPLLEGRVDQVLDGKNKVVLSRSTAEKYFGQISPLGKTIKWKDETTFVVTGVMEDFPSNSHLKLDMISSLDTREDYKIPPKDWGWGDFHTYIEVESGTDISNLSNKLAKYLDNVMGESFAKYNYRVSLKAQPLADIHLYSTHLLAEMIEGGNASSLYFLLGLAGLILTIAWVNFLNLSTARVMKRAKEVGVRKVIGAKRSQLIYQFMFEVLIYNVFAVILSVVLTLSIIPLINVHFGLNLNPDLIWQYSTFAGLVTIIIIGSLLSGLYPSLILTAFSPVQAIKGTKVSGGRWGLRQFLVVFQFSVSIILILGTILMSKQLKFMRSQSLGLNIEQTLVLEGISSVKNEELTRRIELFKDEVKNISAIDDIAVTSAVPGKRNYLSIAGFYSKHNPSESKDNYRIYVDETFFQEFEIELLAGRSFEKGRKTDESAILINESSMKLLGFNSPEEALNGELSQQGKWKIIGVVKDYHQSSLQNAIEPTVFFLDPSKTEYISLKLNTETIGTAMSSISSAWAEIFPELPFSYFYLDAAFDKQYKADEEFKDLFRSFSVLAIIVACLGLFGLVSFTAEQRKKEIGVRKVLGASTLSMMLLLIKSYTNLIIIAMLIAFPLGYFAMKRWLQGFAYQAPIDITLFIYGGVLISLVAVFTVSFKSFKAASTNPVKVLRNE